MTARDLRLATTFLLLITCLCAKASAQFTGIWTFNANVDGDAPMEPDLLAQGNDAIIYGTLPSGARSSAGSFFQDVPGAFPNFIPSAGDGVTIPDSGLHNPASGYMLAIDGNLYGAAQQFGTSTSGAIIKLSAGVISSPFQFSPPPGVTSLIPHAPPVMGLDHNLYGVVCESSSTAWVYQVITSTTPWSSGWSTKIPSCSQAALFLANDGNMYGTYPLNSFVNGMPTQGGFGGIFAINYTGMILWSYNMNPGAGDGAYPQGGVIQASDNNLYGTNSAVANSSNAVSPTGNIFTIALNGGSFRALHLFQTSDGISPQSGLVQGSDGMLYGLCSDQGALGPFIPLGTTAHGTIFKMALDGSNFTRLFTFTRNSNNAGQGPGSDPESTPLLHTSGDLWGMTHDGGSSRNGASGGQSGGYDDGGELFKYHTGMAPFINTITRRYGRPGQSVSLIGQGFLNTTSVKFGGTEVDWTTKGSVLISSDTYMTVRVPNFAHPGSIVVTETNSTGAQNTLSTTYSFRICNTFPGNCP
ncbi:hypothetical protein DYQ86_17900 [Acidobacteria bacterium AB60]|nr:hypothetical protein DYQ86_17900 [Acidobacteria bacterium AB60]